jgi:hypothetical protein
MLCTYMTVQFFSATSYLTEDEVSSDMGKLEAECPDFLAGLLRDMVVPRCAL